MPGKVDLVSQPLIWPETDRDRQWLRVKVFGCESLWRGLSEDLGFSFVFSLSPRESSWIVCVTCISSFIRVLGSCARWALGRNGEKMLQSQELSTAHGRGSLS